MTMNPLAVKLLAREWFLAGFAASGRGFNGELLPVEQWPALESILSSEFERIWYGQEHESD